METIRYWLKGIRLYIALTTLLVTGFVLWWAHSMYAGTTLYPTRLEEVYAWLSTGLLAFTLSIGPTYKLFANLPGRKLLFDARRLLGVSAAWFAILHVGISYGSLFKFANPLDLPGNYQRSFLAGTVALLVLLVMAVTSFDAAMKAMGVWWFRLHRLLYAASGLILLHAFISGVHATETFVLVLLTVIVVLLISMHTALLVRKRPTVWRLTGISAMILYLLLVMVYGFIQHGRVG